MDDIFGSGDELHIDGDILVYKPCCIHVEDTDRDRELIANNIDRNVSALCADAGVSCHETYLTTKKNFRDFLVDDYKANRIGKPRPVNLAFAKKYMIEHHGATYVPYLEADDLLAINQTKNSIIWSLDKDLKQVPGKHLDDVTREIIVIDELGAIWKEGSKWRFSGYKGLMFQALTGDGADWIVGCGTRSGKMGKSGFKARQGIGPAAAAKILNACPQTKEAFEEAVYREYMTKFGMDDWKAMVETQVNLLYMVEEFEGNMARRWTQDGRVELMDITTGEFSEEIL